MYNANIFKESNIKLNISDIYYGLNNELLDIKQINDAILLCDNCEIVIEILGMLFCIDSINKTDALKIIKDEMDKRKMYCNNMISKAKWEYCIVKHIFTTYKDFDDQKIKMEDAYANLNYPKEMKGFVYYMPTDDLYNPTLHTREENILRIEQNIEKFLLEKEKEFNLK